MAKSLVGSARRAASLACLVAPLAGITNLTHAHPLKIAAIRKATTVDRETKELCSGILHSLAGDDVRAFFGISPEVLIIDSFEPNAFALKPNQIVLSTKLIELIDSQSELAFVLAHEMGHFLLDPHLSGEAVMGRSGRNVDLLLEREIAADSYAIELLGQSGYDREAPVKLLERIGKYTQSLGLNTGELHPSLSKRLMLLKQAVVSSSALKAE